VHAIRTSNRSENESLELSSPRGLRMVLIIRRIYFRLITSEIVTQSNFWNSDTDSVEQSELSMVLSDQLALSTSSSKCTVSAI
jgi:hypothetical protein